MTENAKTDAPPAVRKPRVASGIATAFGLGYMPKAPGTWGSLAGIAAYAIIAFYFPLAFASGPALGAHAEWLAATELPIGLLIAGIGVWSASCVAAFHREKDPQWVVVDEVSGQFLTYLFALSPLRWQYLLLGFILFRVFDIWKPFPVRHAESLPGGWGIMADDWLAAVYAAFGLWIARAAGL